MTNYPRTEDYEYYCTDIMAWNCYCSVERLTTLRLSKMLTTFTTFELTTFNF